MEDKILGFIFVIISVLFFGSNFVPVKKLKTGDGLHFAHIMSTGVLLVGFVTYLIYGAPKFEPIACIGGIIWTHGNLCVVPVIKCIGLSMGMLLWGSTNMLMGWATGRFGLFGIDQTIPANSDLNYAGVAVCFIGACIYGFVKTEIASENDLFKDISIHQPLNRDPIDVSETSYIETLSPRMKVCYKSFVLAFYFI